MNLRPTGLDAVGDAPRGTHFCQFYRASGELDDALVHYLTKGVRESWCFSGGSFEQQSLLEACIDRLSEPKARGFVGFRSSGDTSWLEQPVPQRFAQHEVAIDPTPRFSAATTASPTLVERCAVVDGCQGNQRQPFAVSWRNNAWEIIDGPDRQRLREEQLRALALDRERLSVTLHSIGEAVVATDNSSRVMTLNRAAEE